MNEESPQFNEAIENNIQRNIQLVNDGHRPEHYSIPSEYYRTIFDPTYWDERQENYKEVEEMRRQTLRSRCDSSDYD